MYDKAQQFAVAVAAANGVLDTEDDEDPTEGIIAEAPDTDRVSDADDDGADGSDEA